MALAVPPYIKGLYGIAGPWCWVQSLEDCKPTGLVTQMVFFSINMIAEKACFFRHILQNCTIYQQRSFPSQTNSLCYALPDCTHAHAPLLLYCLPIYNFDPSSSKLWPMGGSCACQFSWVSSIPTWILAILLPYQKRYTEHYPQDREAL